MFLLQYDYKRTYFSKAFLKSPSASQKSFSSLDNFLFHDVLND